MMLPKLYERRISKECQKLRSVRNREAWLVPGPTSWSSVCSDGNIGKTPQSTRGEEGNGVMPYEFGRCAVKHTYIIIYNNINNNNNNNNNNNDNDNNNNNNNNNNIY